MNEINGPAGGYRLGAYQERAAPSPLQHVAEVAWKFVAPLDGQDRPRHRVIPETGVSLCLVGHLGPSVRVEDRLSMVMGPVHTPRLFEPPPGLVMVGLRIRPEWCVDLLGIAPGDHVDLVEPTPRATVRRLSLEPCGPGRLVHPDNLLDHLVQAVGRRLEQVRFRRNAALAHAALEVIRGVPAAAIRIADLARDQGVSARHLRRVIGEQCGSTPKFFHRVRRFQHAVSLAERAASEGWARLAVGSGFYDQAHLIHECRHLTGRTPVEMLRERREQRAS